MAINWKSIPDCVPPHGPPDGKIAFVGEAPGKDEHANGIPFIGSSGELFCEILGKAGIHRRILKRYNPDSGFHFDVSSSVYVTNLVKVFPGQDFARTFYTDRKQSTPTAELTKWTEILKMELSQCKANVIVAVGEHSLRALTGKYGITKWRGSILESTLLPGRKVIPMIHPAAVLREWGFKAYCVMDAKRVAEEAKTPEINLPKRRYIIRPSIDIVIEQEARFQDVEWCSFDIETKYNNIACIAFSDSPDFSICIPFIAHGRNYWTSTDIEVRAWQAVQNILGAPSKKVAQNALFDMTHLRCHGVIVKNMYHDTMLCQNILYPELAKGLDVLASMYTREPYYKSIGRAALKLKSDKAWDPSQDDDTLWIYNNTDAAVTLEVALEQQKDFAELH